MSLIRLLRPRKKEPEDYKVTWRTYLLFIIIGIMIVATIILWAQQNLFS